MPGRRWTQRRSWSGGDDDSAIFARWAEDYSGALAQAGGLDDAQLADWLAHCAPEVAAWRDAGVMLAGFIELSPQQERLLAALAAVGTRIERRSTLPSVDGEAIGRATRQTGATPRDEVGQALTWARERARRSRRDSRDAIGLAIPAGQGLGRRARAAVARARR
jgi:hypothetical protein